MAIYGIPTPKISGEILNAGADEILKNILERNRLQQEALANQQLNQYRQGTLDLDKQKLGIEKQKLPYEMELLKSRSDAQKFGLGARGVDAQNVMGLMREAINSNPGMSMSDASKTASAWINGDTSFEDGSPVPSPTGTAKYFLDAAAKRRTTTMQLNNALNAKGGEAEIKALSDISTGYNKPYGTTYFGKSPQQVMDTFKNDDESQTRLGKFIAGQQLQFAVSQAENRIAMGQAGITNTHDMLNRSMQIIDAKYPRLSAKAREVAQKEFIGALEKGLKARLKSGFNARNAFTSNNENEGLSNISSEAKTKDQWKQYTINELSRKKNISLDAAKKIVEDSEKTGGV